MIAKSRWNSTAALWDYERTDVSSMEYITQYNLQASFYETSTAMMISQ